MQKIANIYFKPREKKAYRDSRIATFILSEYESNMEDNGSFQ